MDSLPLVLLVDDERPILELVTRCLAGGELPAPGPVAQDGLETRRLANGIRLLLADSGERAIELVEAELEQGRRISCGFFDLRLAGEMDGVETLRRVRRLDPDILCTVISGHGDRSIEDIEEIFLPDHGDEWDFLAKPFSPWEIRQKCRQMVASWERRRAEESHVAEIGRLTRRLEERGQALETRLRRRSEELERLKAASSKAEEQAPAKGGRRTPNTRLTEATRVAVLALLREGYGTVTIAKALRLHRSTVWLIERDARADEAPHRLLKAE